ATGTEKDAHKNIASYLERLEMCGVVERLGRHHPGEDQPGPASGHFWRLTRNLGQLAPVWRWRQRELWDPNRCQVVAPLAAAPQEQASSVTSETGFEHD
ncbi:MAG: hypothetical protein NTZ64_15145, partial [Polaromonas sp.]|nr:hypothetical protein [Polaromonas sp.]